MAQSALIFLNASTLAIVRIGEAQEDLVEEVVPLAHGELRILRPRDSEALLDEEAFEHEEFLPYWAELWPSGATLARDVSNRSLRGARTLELGCGLALPSMAAALAGGRVLATDWSPDAMHMVTRNAERSGARLETLVCDWARPEPLLERAPWDLVLAADVLYERRNVDTLGELLPRLVDTRGEILLADPGRVTAEAFLERAVERFDLRTTSHGPVMIHRLRLRA
jgi:predicted nicotinamide N-methyase